MKLRIFPPALAQWMQERPKAAPHPVMAELRLCLRRIGIKLQMHRIDVQERQAAIELAYERAHVAQASQNFNALLVSNQQLRECYEKQLQALTEGA